MKQKTKFKQTEIGEIPEDWEVKELNEITSYITEKINLDEIKTNNFISTKNMLPEKRGIVLSSSLPKVGKVTQFKEGDILFSNIRTYFKKLWLAKFSGGCSNDVLVIRKKSFMDDKYIYYYLSQDKFFDFTVLTSKGTKMPRGDKNSIMSYEINVPPISEQSAIAKILSDLDSKIELNQQMNKTLEAIGQVLFKHWFIDFEFPNEKGKPYKSSGGEMIDSKIGKVPREWQVSKLGQFLKITKGCSYKSEDLKESNNALVTLKSINREGGFNQEGYKEYVGSYKEEQVVKDREIVVAQTDITQDAEVIGTPAIINSLNRYDKLIASLDLQILRIKDRLNYGFLYFLLKTAIFHNHALSYTNGTTVLHLNKDAVPEFNFIIPSENILSQFGQISNAIIEKINRNVHEIFVLSQIRDSLLPRLMSGKIRVPVEVK